MNIVLETMAGILALLVLALLSFVALLRWRRRSQMSRDEMLEIEIPSPGDPTGVNRSKAMITKKGYQFQPYLVPEKGESLEKAGLRAEEGLILLERGQEKRLFSMREMAYHHVAQGELAGEPYLVSF
jgi:hypothetical protein